WSKGQACSFTDAFTELEPLLEQADALVFVTPLYWFGFSAQIKAAIDRTYAYASPNALRPLKIKESALLVCAGDTDTSVFNGLISMYETMMLYLNWQNSGILTVPGVLDKGDILKTDAQEKARQLGMRF
ncbi:NAD(P)H-dependent oxidoreductase, partial [Desulfosarcina sp. OttesenSCG-928-B08]|nr:NAD(P)H-dependent oxidoreductase [Desulfosarcina sp. OttesenSCG-928-B08]